MAQQTGHHVNYFLVFVALCMLTLLSVATDVVHIPNKVALSVLVLSVASAKALFVLMFFMHLKFEGRWKYVLLAPTTILAIGLPLALLPDIALHYYSSTVGETEAAAHGRLDPGHDDHSAGDHPH